MTNSFEDEKKPVCPQCGKELVTEFFDCPDGHSIDDRFKEELKRQQGGGSWIRYQSHEGPLEPEKK